MIESRKDLREYLMCDKQQLGITRKFPRPFTDEIWKYEIALRKYEYWYNKKSILAKIVRVFYKLRWHRWSIKLSIGIGPNVCDKGLSIAHSGAININQNARIGKNCRIHEGVTVGASGGNDAPTIGDNVFLASGCKVMGKVMVESGCVVGANAVVVEDVLEKNIAEYSSFYKSFFTLWLYMAVVCIAVIVLSKVIKNRVTISKCCKEIILYYIAMFVITLIVRMSFHDGLQKMFAAPMLVLFMYIELEINPVDFIKSVNRILMCSFILGLTAFNPMFWSSMFAPEKNHLFFWGHVQVGAQLGLMSIVFSYAEYILLKKREKRKLFFRIALALGVMLISATSMSYMIIAVLLMYTLLYEKVQLKWKGKKYVTIYIFLNMALFFIITKIGPALNIGRLSLNGRGFIWEKAIESFCKSPLWGYGVYGVLIQVFWSKLTGDGSGMNYMHNQLLQVANDGGLILIILFVRIIYSVMDSIDKIPQKGIRKRCGGFMVAVLIIMSFESGLEYIYLLMALILLGEMKNLTVYKQAICNEYRGNIHEYIKEIL